MKTKEAHPLGIVFVTLIFLSIPVALFFGNYHLENLALHMILVGAVSGVLTFCVTSVLFWISQLRPIRFGRGWYHPRSFESTDRYRRLGTRLFRTLLLNSSFRFLNQDVYLRGSSRRAVAETLRAIDAAETNHVLGLILMIPLAVVYGIVNSSAFIPWLIAFNVAGNLYPFLLQRMTRLRLVAVLQRARSKP